MTTNAFNNDDCQTYLDRDLLSGGYQPIQITLVNNSDHYFDFSLAHFSFPCDPAEAITPKFYSSTSSRILGYGIPGLLIFPLLIPAVVDGIWSFEANQELDADFARKALVNQIIKPYYTINGLIFVPVECFEPYFSFNLIDQDNQKQITLTTTQLSVAV